MGSEFWAAVVGAIVGGAIAGLVQYLSLRTAKRDRDDELLRQRQTLARSLLLKVVKILSDFKNIHDHISECEENRIKNNLEKGWKSFLPLSATPRQVEFTSEELTTLTLCNDDDLFNEVLAIDEVHAGYMESLALYRSLRATISERFPAMMLGTIGTIELTPDEYKWYAPRAAELDQLAEDIASHIAEEVDPEMTLPTRLAAAFNRSYSMRLGIGPKKSSELNSNPDQDSSVDGLN